MLYFFIGLGAVILLLLIVAALRPSAFRISRSATVDASPAQAFDKVNDLHEFQTWNPWAKIDPKATETYEGSASGVGAIYRWSGNSHVGAGSMTITEVQPNRLVRMKLEFLKPFKGTNDVEFTFEPEGNQTRVSWTMSGRYVFPAKLFGLFCNMEKMIGGQFEKGLATLKSLLEGPKTGIAA